MMNSYKRTFAMYTDSPFTENNDSIYYGFIFQSVLLFQYCPKECRVENKNINYHPSRKF